MHKIKITLITFLVGISFHLCLAQCPTITTIPYVSGGGALCPGGSINVTLSNSQVDVTYLFMLNGTVRTAKGGTGSTLIYSANELGNYTVKGVSSCNTTGVLMPGTASVYSGIPAVQQITLGGPHCGGGTSITISDTETGVNYQLYRDGYRTIPAWTINGTGNAFSWAGLEYGTYSVIAYRPACPGVASVPMAGEPIIYPIPSQNLIAEGTTNLCAGSSVTLSTDYHEVYTYSWKLNSVVVPGANKSSLTVTAPGLYQAFVSSAGCTISTIVVNITNSALPTASFTYSGSATLCEGQSTTLTSSATTGLTFKWFRNDVYIPFETASTLVVKTPGEYKLQTSNGTCTNTSPATIFTFNANPVAKIAASGPTSLCNGEKVTLGAVDYQASGHTYQWKQGASNIAGTASIEVGAAAVYKVIVTANGCSKTSNEITTTVTAQPAAPTNITGVTTDATAIAGDKINYAITAPAGADTYHWNLPDGSMATYTNNKLNANIGLTRPGARKITVYAVKNGCYSIPFSKNIEVIEAVSSFPTTIPKEFSVSPTWQTIDQPLTPGKALSDFTNVPIQSFSPTCTATKYRAAFELKYNPLEGNTADHWQTSIEVTLIEGANTLDTRPLSLDMSTQSIKHIVFTDNIVSCASALKLKLKSKLNSGTVPEDLITLSLILYPVEDLPFLENPPTSQIPLPGKPLPAFTSYPTSLPTSRIASINWSYVDERVKEYDLEWVFIDTKDNITPADAPDAFKKRQPVRITTNQISYQHHIYYPAGKIWYRIRAVGYNPLTPQHRIESTWVYGAATTITNHDATHTWAAQTVYAEEGKYKKILTYYDGTSRPRQVQTNLSSESTTLVSETLYDFEGRKSVDVLPVPITPVAATPALAYLDQFNRFNNYLTAPIERKYNYDNGSVVNQQMSSAFGASKYYSPQNAFTQSPNRNYIANANGYVFSQTEYLNDGTQRIRKQSGVGEAFRMDGGRSTQYFYTEASDTELQRLFGTNVGNANHYKKNVVVDGNGQVSISYMDQADRVIATALAGEAPKELSVNVVDPLPSSAVASTTVNISSKNKKENGESLTVHKILNETLNTTYTFQYSLKSFAADLGEFGCEACKFDLDIFVTGPDGKPVDMSPSVVGNESQNLFVYSRKNISSSAICATETTLPNISISYTFAGVGDYTLTKRLVPQLSSYEQAKAEVEGNQAFITARNAIAAQYPVDPAECEFCDTCGDQITPVLREVTVNDCNQILENIIYELEATTPDVPVTESEIQQHSRYCEYQLCVDDIESSLFEKELSRIESWTAATVDGVNYQNVSTVSSLVDPFFIEEMNGFNYKTQMQQLLDNFTFTVGDATNGVKVFTGSLAAITNPALTAYYIDKNNNLNPTDGFHFLYWDLMERRAKGKISVTDYPVELNKQRWVLFKNFYIEAKRKLKLTIPAYSGCAAAKSSLERMETELASLPPAYLTKTPEELAPLIENWSGNAYILKPISAEELDAYIVALEITCACTFLESDLYFIRGHLETYFNGNKQNFLRMILSSDLGTHPSLTGLQQILQNNYGCDLGDIANTTPTQCLEFTKQNLSKNLIKNPALVGSTGTITNSSVANWKPIHTPYLRSDKTFTLTSDNNNDEALIGAIEPHVTNPQGALVQGLVLNRKYRLRFKYRSEIAGGTSVVYLAPTSDGTRPGGQPLASQGGGDQLMATTMALPTCPSPNTGPPVAIDPIKFTTNGVPQDFVWTQQHTTTTTAFITVTIEFYPQYSGSQYIYFIQKDCNGVEARTAFREVELTSIQDLSGDICIQYPANEAYTTEAFTAKCMERQTQEKASLVKLAQDKFTDSKIAEWIEKQKAGCENTTEVLTYQFNKREHHYTLYYYDQSGNLIQTVAPKGVTTGGSGLHTFTTKYKYNSLNQLTWQSTPDAGTSTYLYDKKGQLRLSQNAKQLAAATGKYSYTKYDPQGRIMEVGEAAGLTSPPTDLELNNVTFPTAGTLTDITKTYYDAPNLSVYLDLLQTNLRGRVSWVEVIDPGQATKTTTYYSYDPHGNVKSLLQELPALGKKRTDYVYDLISNKVNYVFYQYAEADQFIHKYTYDADNRLQSVATSTDAFTWYDEAFYQYYAHGPLARIELGEVRVQGLDYTYTLQGWIKGVNMPYDRDPAGDGASGDLVGKDAFAYRLGYYENDYLPISSVANLESLESQDNIWAAFRGATGIYSGLYNGNISWMITDLPKIGQNANAREKGVQGMAYRYDQLNRITKSKSLVYTTENSNEFKRIGTAYDEVYTYDPNGNLSTLTRNSETGAVMDQFNYSYITNTNKLAGVKTPTSDNTLTFSSGPITSNTTIHRNIVVGGTAYVPANGNVTLTALESIKFQPSFNTQNGGKLYTVLKGATADEYDHVYDEIGNIIKDREADEITWTPYGKVREVKMKNGTSRVKFRYDGAGNRIEKRALTQQGEQVTHYVRDASGNVMAIYKNLVVTERPIYGSSRLGEFKGAAPEGRTILGERTYELSNHLGNVLAVITDNAVMASDLASAKVISTSDYYPFGLAMKGRTWNETNSYRYGFNGKEKDDGGEWSTTTYDYGFRIYNPSLGRFLSVDPLTKEYPWYTPYQFAGNTPIQAIDLDGLEEYHYLLSFDNDGKAHLNLIAETDIIDTELTISWTEGIKTNTYVNSRKQFIVHTGEIHKGHINERIYEQEINFRYNSEEELNEKAKSFSIKDIAAVKRGLWWGDRVAEGLQNIRDERLMNPGRFLPKPRDGKGTRNPKVRTAVDLGNRVHYDKLAGGSGVGLPTELTVRYPNTTFKFTRRGQKGADVEVVGGKHPSLYENSKWSSSSNFADFKPNSVSGKKTFNSDIKSGKLPQGAQLLTYDTGTGKLN